MHKPFTKILVPVDFSSYSTEALLYALSLAERFQSTIVVLHVIAHETEMRVNYQHVGHRGLPLLGPFSETLDIPAEATDTILIDLREQARIALQKFLPPEFGGRAAHLGIEVGHPFECILETANREHIDLIVMGTHGRTGLAHAVLGSVAERVVRLAPCPVLTVKAPTVS